MTAAAPRAAEWLVRPSRVARCDLMVVLGGGARERMSTAMDLMADGACERLLFTGAGFEANGGYLQPEPPAAEGPRRAPMAARSRSTLDDAVVALRAARSGGDRFVLVVTSPYHTRRASWVFSRVLAGTGIRFGVYPSETFYMDYRRWWESRDGLSLVLGEYVKLWLYGLASELLVAGTGRLA